MTKYPKVTIIVPLYVIEPRFFDDLKKFDKLDYPDYEILVVSDKKVNLGYSRARLILTGQKRTGPAEKRDIAIKEAKGAICAFIDDDAYPDPKWLKSAVGNIKGKVVAVGGPGVTPSEDGFWEQVTGVVYMSYFCGGHTQHRFVRAKKKEVLDYPAYNLIIRKSVLEEVGGYGNHFYGGEDTFLCLKIVNAGYKILYDPGVVVYHHRRPLFLPYLKQIANIGRHRGYFAKKYPETSRYFSYFLPSILAVGFIGGLAVVMLQDSFRMFFLVLFSIFYFLAFMSVVAKTDVLKALLASVGIILTHLSYGVYFIIGIFSSNLKR